jgi:hypothetical protein
MTSSYIWFSIFFCAAYLIITDESVAAVLYMLIQLAKFQYEKTKWWTLHNPENPIVRYLIWRRSMKIAKQLEKEFKNR